MVMTLARLMPAIHFTLLASHSMTWPPSAVTTVSLISSPLNLALVVELHLVVLELHGDGERETVASTLPSVIVDVPNSELVVSPVSLSPPP